MAKSQMVSKIVDIEIMLCQNEVEALVLETNLIKHLSPKYNILMKDDKNLAYIKITP
jgi:excinuclease ABC subunit C